jgi:hypothetical protein
VAAAERSGRRGPLLEVLLEVLLDRVADRAGRDLDAQVVQRCRAHGRLPGPPDYQSDPTGSCDPLLPKPDRPRSSPAKVGIRAGRGRLGVVRGCPQETGHDRCECTLVARPVRPTPYTVPPLVLPWPKGEVRPRRPRRRWQAANAARQRLSVPSGRGRLRRSGPPRPGTDRRAGHGKADQSLDPLACHTRQPS